jgi:hypothetical protein
VTYPSSILVNILLHINQLRIPLIFRPEHHMFNIFIFFQLRQRLCRRSAAPNATNQEQRGRAIVAILIQCLLQGSYREAQLGDIANLRRLSDGHLSF